jgi:hypothetical protein
VKQPTFSSYNHLILLKKYKGTPEKDAKGETSLNIIDLNTEVMEL